MPVGGFGVGGPLSIPLQGTPSQAVPSGGGDLGTAPGSPLVNIFGGQANARQVAGVTISMSWLFIAVIVLIAIWYFFIR